MSKFSFIVKFLAVSIFMLAFFSMAQAQASRTWVSGVGDDANPCSRTAPCKTFAGAISKTGKDGEINCLDPGGFGGVTITKSITIDASPTTEGGILNPGTSSIIVNITDVNDLRKFVTLRGISINGAGSGLRGVLVLAATRVVVENCFIVGNNSSPGNGIEDSRTTGGSLDVFNTTIMNNFGNGISVNPSSGNTSIHVHIVNCRFHANASNGLFLGSNAQAVVSNSMFTQNIVGIFAQQTTGGTTSADIDHCVVSNNLTGFQANTQGSIIGVSNTTAMNNSTLATINGGGIVTSYGNNHAGGVAFPSPGTGPS